MGAQLAGLKVVSLPAGARSKICTIKARFSGVVPVSILSRKILFWSQNKKTSRAPASCVLISQSKAFDLWTWVLPRPAWVFGSPDCLMTGCEKLCLFECVLVCFTGCSVWVLVVLAEWDALCWFWFFGGLVAVWWLCGCLRAWLIFCVLVVWLFGCLVVWVVCPTRLYT